VASELLANENRTVKITPTPPGAWTPGSAGGHTYIETKGDFEIPKGLTNKVMIEKIDWTAIGCTLTSYTFGTGVGSMVGTAQVQSNTKKCMRDKDSGLCTGGFTLTASPYTPLVCTCTFEIDDPGQNDVESIE